MKVVYFTRKPDRVYSIENLFTDIKADLPPFYDVVTVQCKFLSKGFFRRLYNSVEAAFKQGDVNHVTGDIHYVSLFLNKKKTILTIHDLASVHRLNGIKKKIFLLFWFYLPILRSSYVTVISEHTKSEMIKLIAFQSNKIRVIPNCVSNVFKHTPKVFNGEKPIVLQVGTTPNKNLLNVADALNGVACHFRIIGNINDQEKEHLKMNKIEFSSRSDLSNLEMVEEYQKCDIVVFASTYEGFGLPILEAQATGRPLITSNLSPMKNVAGENAILVDPFSVDDIHNAILSLINSESLRNKTIAAGLLNINKYCPSTISHQYAELYHELKRSYC